jgi:hypothetical protein
MSKETLNEQPIEKIFNHIGKCCLDKLKQPHYSEQKGHRARSEYWKTQRKLNVVFKSFQDGEEIIVYRSKKGGK